MRTLTNYRRTNVEFTLRGWRLLKREVNYDCWLNMTWCCSARNRFLFIREVSFHHWKRWERRQLRYRVMQRESSILTQTQYIVWEYRNSIPDVEHIFIFDVNPARRVYYLWTIGRYHDLLFDYSDYIYIYCSTYSILV